MDEVLNFYAHEQSISEQSSNLWMFSFSCIMGLFTNQ